MTATNFVLNVAQSGGESLGIRLLFAGLPFLGFVVGAVLFRRFSLDDDDGTPSAVALRVPSAP
jgi:Na+/melibiose symporter-like transporter